MLLAEITVCLILCSPAPEPYVQDGYLPPPPPLELLLHVDPPQPEPAPTPAPKHDLFIYRGMGNGTSDVEQWRPLVAGHFPPEQVENALCVIRSESGGNELAKNPNSNARGIFQIMTSVWGPHFGFSYEEFYEPEKNAYAAVRIWEDSGWRPWSPRTRRNCGL